jgi:hypothetical protein
MLNKWKIFFKHLRSQRLYSRKLLPDCITMLFVYLPIIREQTGEFVRVWNIHLIRKQPNRPHIVPGQPFQNYMFSEQMGVRDYGIPINIDKLNELREGYASYDKDAYLHLSGVSRSSRMPALYSQLRSVHVTRIGI